MGLLVALFALAATVWMVPIIHRGRILNIATIVLLTGTVFGPFFFAIDGPIQISLDRVLWVAMFGLLAVQWRMGNVELPKAIRIDWLVIGLTAYLMVSSMRGGEVPRGVTPFARWLFYIAMPFGMYAIARTVPLRKADVRWFFAAVIALGLYLSVTGMLELKGLHWGVFPGYITDPEHWEFYGRGRGPLLNPIANGMLIGIALVATVLAFFRAERRGKLLLAVAGIVLLGGIYATLTRSCWMGAIGAVALLAMIYSPRWVRVLGLASVVLLSGAMAMGLKDQLLALKRDKELSAAEAAKSVELRPLLAVVAYEMFKDQPVIGHGFGHYFEHSPKYHDVRSYKLPLERVRTYHQHNSFLAMVVDGGLVGISMFGGALFWFALTAWDLARRSVHSIDARCIGLLMLGTLVVYTSNAMFHDVIIIPMMQMFLMFIAGLTVSAHQRGVQELEPNRLREIVPATAPTPVATPAT